MAEIGGVRPTGPVITGIAPHDKEKKQQQQKEQDESNDTGQDENATHGSDEASDGHIDVTV